MGSKKKRQAPSSEEEDDDSEALASEDEDMLNAQEGSSTEEEQQDQPSAGALRPSGKGGSKRPVREPIYDVDAMHEKLEDIGWADGVPWEETLALTHDDPAQVQDVDDDMARELSFYNQALEAAQEAIRRFDASSIPWLRPSDYYAEMVKTDQHMAKVKEQLMFEQRSIEQAEERRKTREAKQYSKQVQAEKQKERNAAKKKQIESVASLRKQREKSGYGGELNYDKEMAEMERKARKQSPRSARKNARAQQDRGGPNSKGGPINKGRAAKDAKFGFGGAKRKLGKQNNAESAANMEGFKSHREGKGGPGGKFGGGKKGPGGVQKGPMKRPGKSARGAHKAAKSKAKAKARRA